MMAEQYQWLAWYGPDDTLEETAANGDEHNWAEVDAARLREFALTPLEPGLPRVVVQRGTDERVCFTRQRSITLDLSTGGQTWDRGRTVVGLEVPAGATVYLHILPNGECVLTTRNDLNGG